MKVDEHNYAFIDAQNLYKSMKNAGWKLDYYKFREYLRRRFGVEKAIVFIGRQERYRSQYKMYHRAGFELEFKEAVPHRRKDGSMEMKANVDVDLAVGVLGKYVGQYDKAVIVSGDSDFLPLYLYLKNIGKMGKILIPDRRRYSTILESDSLKEHLVFMSDPEEKSAILLA